MKDQKSKGVKVVKYIECSAIVQKNLKNVFDEAIKIAMFGEGQEGRKKNKSCAFMKFESLWHGRGIVIETLAFRNFLYDTIL